MEGGENQVVVGDKSNDERLFLRFVKARLVMKKHYLIEKHLDMLKLNLYL